LGIGLLLVLSPSDWMSNDRFSEAMEFLIRGLDIAEEQKSWQDHNARNHAHNDDKIALGGRLAVSPKDEYSPRI